MEKILRQSDRVKSIIDAIVILITLAIIAVIIMGCNNKSISSTPDLPRPITIVGWSTIRRVI